MNFIRFPEQSAPIGPLLKLCCGRGFSVFVSALVLATFSLPARAQESPYIVTYDHYLEEPGSLEVEYFSTFGTQRGGNDFHSFWTEFEYGATAWWTTLLTGRS